MINIVLKEGLIEWVVDDKIAARHISKSIMNLDIVWMHFIAMANKEDTVELLDW